MQGREQSVSATIKFAVDRMLGAEVTSSTPAGCTVQVLTDDAKEKFDLVLRRIFRLLPEMFDTYIEGTQSDVDVFRETVNFKHNQIKKFVNYGLRLLNKFGHEDASKTTFYFAIIDYLGKIDEIMKNMVEYAIKNNKQRIGKKCLAYMKEVKNAFDSYHAFFYSYDLKKVTEFHKNRDLFKLRNSDAFRTMNQEEVYILASFTQIYDILIDLSELRMSIGY